MLVMPVSGQIMDLDQLEDEATPEFTSVTDNIRVLIVCLRGSKPCKTPY